MGIVYSECHFKYLPLCFWSSPLLLSQGRKQKIDQVIAINTHQSYRWGSWFSWLQPGPTKVITANFFCEPNKYIFCLSNKYIFKLWNPIIIYEALIAVPCIPIWVPLQAQATSLLIHLLMVWNSHGTWSKCLVPCTHVVSLLQASDSWSFSHCSHLRGEPVVRSPLCVLFINK